MKRTLIHSNTAFTEKTKAEIKAAAEAAQKLLNIWNSYKLPPLSNLFELVHNPTAVYQRAGAGSLLPDELIIAARVAKDHIVIGNPDLISIQDNSKVVINEAESERLTNVNNVFAENEVQAQFIRDVVQYVALSNSISATLMNLPTTRMPGEPVKRTGRFFPNICTLELETETLQEIIKAL